MYYPHRDDTKTISAALRHYVKSWSVTLVINGPVCDFMPVSATPAWAATYSSQARRSFQQWHQPSHLVPSSTV